MIETDAGLRLAMAELLRRELDHDRPTVRRVTGWRDDTEVHYPGMSCEWSTAVVHIFYDDHTGEPQSYRYEGDFGQLVRHLSNVVNTY